MMRPVSCVVQIRSLKKRFPSNEGIYNFTMINYLAIWDLQDDCVDCLAKVPTVRKIKNQTRMCCQIHAAAHTVQQLCQDKASDAAAVAATSADVLLHPNNHWGQIISP